MSIDSINLYNFYFRYKWAKSDFEVFQQGMVDVTRGASQGAFGAATLSGFIPVTDSVSLDLNVTQGIATSENGTLQAILTDTVKTIVAPTTNRYKALVVVRTVVTPTNYTAEPTNPSNQVPLTNTYTASIEVIYGSESVTPDYPSKLSTDTIICGLSLAPGQTTLNDYDIDLEVREIIGVNSSIQQNYGKYDDRLRCFRFDTTTIAVLPSQLRAPNPIAFTYVNSQTPSIFPQSTLGNYEHGTTYLNFQTGAITGADGVSVDFTPTIPSAGNFINAVVAINFDDTIVVTYGNVGTLSECYTGITSNKESGAGSVSFSPLSKPILAVTLFSVDGTNISDMSSIDLRGFTAVPDVNQIVLTANVDQTIDGNKTFIDNVSCTAVEPENLSHLIKFNYLVSSFLEYQEVTSVDVPVTVFAKTGFFSNLNSGTASLFINKIKIPYPTFSTPPDYPYISFVTIKHITISDGDTFNNYLFNTSQTGSIIFRIAKTVDYDGLLFPVGSLNSNMGGSGMRLYSYPRTSPGPSPEVVDYAIAGVCAISNDNGSFTEITIEAKRFSTYAGAVSQGIRVDFACALNYYMG